MKLLFEEITGKVHRYTISDSCWFPHEDEDFFLTATANISVSRRDRDTVLVKGALEGHRVVACARCGELVQENLHSDFLYLVTTGQEQALEHADIECSDDEAITLYLKGPEIDVDEILREQAYLSFPLRSLCSEDCKGICAGCGVALNTEACRCSLDKSNLAFAALKRLTNS